MSASTRMGRDGRGNNPGTEAQAQGAAAETQIPIDGFQQVLEMLRIADPAFRESLLRRLAARDQNLARELRASLSDPS